MKLVKSGALDVTTLPGAVSGGGDGGGAGAVLDDAGLVGPSVRCIEALPEDTSEYLVGTTRGSILHCSRFGSASAPHVYYAPAGDATAVTALHVSPWLPNYFLAGFASGTVW